MCTEPKRLSVQIRTFTQVANYIMENAINKDIFEDFLEWINSGAITETPPAPNTSGVNSLTEWINSIVKRADIERTPEINPLDGIIKEEVNPYQHWTGDKCEPYTIMLIAN